ncbi:hypothetical protein [Phyllobacterium ifriqiyense]|uniref:hypothetical protein n=1 Tax=Phyllobacterium ifriqiyense TaxID=314238 RepID=UPI0033979089
MTPHIPNIELDGMADAQDRRARRMERLLVWAILILGCLYFWSALAAGLFK